MNPRSRACNSFIFYWFYWDSHGLSRLEIRHFFRHLHITTLLSQDPMPRFRSPQSSSQQDREFPHFPFPESYVVPQIIPRDLGPNLVHAVARNLGNKSPPMQRGVACRCPIPGLLIHFLRNRQDDDPYCSGRTCVPAVRLRWLFAVLRKLRVIKL